MFFDFLFFIWFLRLLFRLGFETEFDRLDFLHECFDLLLVVFISLLIFFKTVVRFVRWLSRIFLAFLLTSLFPIFLGFFLLLFWDYVGLLDFRVNDLLFVFRGWWFWLCVLFQELLLKSGHYLGHFFAVDFETDQMVIHVSKFHHLMVSEVLLHNYFHLLVKLVQIITLCLQQVPHFPYKAWVAVLFGTARWLGGQGKQITAWTVAALFEHLNIIDQ